MFTDFRAKTMNSNPDMHYGHLGDDPYVDKRLQQYLGYILLSVDDGTVILDVGGYMGDMLQLLSQNCDKQFEYHIIDFDDKALAISKQRGAHTHKAHFDTESIDKHFVGKQFDIILCTEVLEHLVDPHRHIAKMKELLKDDGLCVISLPNENSIFHRLMSVIGSGVDQCAFELYKHLHLPSIAQSQKFVSGYFRIEDASYYINPSLKNSRGSWLGKILTLFPDVFWDLLANTLPGLFARGIVFKLRKV